jgi:hypothetical protein
LHGRTGSRHRFERAETPFDGRNTAARSNCQDEGQDAGEGNGESDHYRKRDQLFRDHVVPPGDENHKSSM